MDFSKKIYLATRFSQLVGKLETGPFYEYDHNLIVIVEQDLSQDEAHILLEWCREALSIEVTLHVNLEVAGRVLYEFGFHTRD